MPDAYLTPTIGTVTTPDPGPLPTQCCFVFKVRGPAAGPEATIVSQAEAGAWSWVLQRMTSGDSYALALWTATAAAGPFAPLFGSLSVPPTGDDELLAAAWDVAGATMTLRTWRSIDGGGSWQDMGSYAPATTRVLFDSTGLMRVGAWQGTAAQWNGRIYWCELRTGLNPAAGSVLWRFAASDYPGTGTTYADPRGRVWTLTNSAAITLPPKPQPPRAPVWPGTNYAPRIDIGRPGEVGGQYRYDVAHYNTDGRYGPSYLWEALECQVQSCNIVRGTSSPNDRPQSATASLRLTPIGAQLSPWLIVNGERWNRANLPIRIAITDGTRIYPLFQGWTDVWQDVDNCDEIGTVAISASDGFEHLANLNQAEQAAQGAGEGSGARIRRILTHSSWSTYATLSPGTIEMQATTLARPALEEIFLTADTEAGYVWIANDGTFRFVDRDWLRSKATHLDWRVGDRTIDSASIPASGIITTADDMDVSNVVGISRVGGTALWAEDADSIAKYGRKAWSRFDLPFKNDSDAPYILSLQLGDRAHRDYHIEGVVLSPLTEPSAWPLTLNVELFDTIFVGRTRGTDTLQEYAQIIGIEHTLEPGLVTTTLNLGRRLRYSQSKYDQAYYNVDRYAGT